MLTDSEDVEAELIRQLDLLEEVVQPPCRVDFGADVGEGVEAKFHLGFLSGRVRRDVGLSLFEALEAGGAHGDRIPLRRLDSCQVTKS